MKMQIAIAAMLMTCASCASALTAMSDSIDAGRFALTAACHAETKKCEVARVALNDFIAAYDLALAAKGTPQADKLEQAASDAMGAFLATMQTLSAPKTSGGDDADGGVS